MEAIKVKIIKCDIGHSYDDLIGDIFEVDEYDSNYYSIKTGENTAFLLLKSDCEVIQEKPYPKMMYVWDEDDDEEEKHFVLCEVNGFYLVADSIHKESDVDIRTQDRIVCYRFAEDLPERTKLTKKEIADKFGVDVELLDIEDK